MRQKTLSRLLSCAVVAFAAALPLAVSAQQLTVSAAASLTDAFKEIGTRFEAAKAGATVRFNFAASGVLLQQVSQGAPVDVFASADQETMTRGVDQKLIDPATRRDFATNSLVLIEPGKDGVGIKSLQDLNGPAVKKIAVGKVATVPVGRYTKQALDAANLWNALEPRFVQADSVRQVLDYVSRGEVEAGFVYRTDAALMGDKVKIVLTATGHTPVSYPVAVVADSKQKALAQEFITFLSSGASQEILARYGFGKP
jgi:molybdate transport system substrate-binding protein